MKFKRTLTGYVREHLEEIETRIELGYSLSQLLFELNQEHEFGCSLPGFKTALYVARKWRRKKIEQSGGIAPTREKAHQQESGLHQTPMTTQNPKTTRTEPENKQIDPAHPDNFFKRTSRIRQHRNKGNL